MTARQALTSKAAQIVYAAALAVVMTLQEKNLNPDDSALAFLMGWLTAVVVGATVETLRFAMKHDKWRPQNLWPWIVGGAVAAF